eukprot:symbB.v1.2.017850.t1/scaffold1401.1/size121277/3
MAPAPKRKRTPMAMSSSDSAGTARTSREKMQALQCPITKELMVDPVVAQDGYTYDRPSIEQHWTNQLQGQLASSSEDTNCGATMAGGPRRTSPITGEELDGVLRVNRVVLDLIRNAIQEGILPPETVEDWERRRQEVEVAQRQQPNVQVEPQVLRAPESFPSQLASAPPYERSAEHVRVLGHADPPRWGLAAKVQWAKTALACDFSQEDAWAPKFMFACCMVPGCNVAFGLFKRRHHCRRCGRLVCSTCAPHSAVDFEMLGMGVNSDSLEQRRICGECVEDLLDRLERRALTATEVQQIMVLDARLEQWTQIQCEKHRQSVRVELTRRFEPQLATQQEEAEREEIAQRHHQMQVQRELQSEIQRLNRIDTSVMDDATVLRHVQHLSQVEANLSDLQREMLHSDTAMGVLSTESSGTPPAESAVQQEEVDELDPTLVALRERWEHLMRQEVMDLTTEEAFQHFDALEELQQQIEAAETQAALARSAMVTMVTATTQQGPVAVRRVAFHEGSFSTNETNQLQRSRWPLPMGLEVPMVWPTARMRKREEMIFRARRREALLVREEFETKMTNLVQARQLQMERRRELDMLREQEELQRQQTERVAEERRQRAQELDDLARRAVTQMVGRNGTARMCGRCRAGPIMNDACSNLATHNRDQRRRANHCPRCNWFDRNWNKWPEWDGIYGPH